MVVVVLIGEEEGMVEDKLRGLRDIVCCHLAVEFLNRVLSLDVQ